MSSGGSQQPVTTTQTSDPWAGAQPHMRELMENAQGYFQTGTGYQPYSGQTQATPNPALTMGEATASGMAQGSLGGTPNVIAAQGLAGGMIGSQGISPGQWGSLVNMKNSESMYADLYNRAKDAENPYLLATIAGNDRRIADRVNSAMSGAGRYGSGAHTDVLARSLAEAANPILAQDYQSRQAQQMAATQGYQGVQGQAADIYSGGLARAGQFAQLAPGLDEATFANTGRLMGLGQQATARDQATLNDQINLYNAQQSYPWEQLARYSGIVGGMGGLGGTRITSAPPPYQASSLQRGLGGALAGAGAGSIFGAPGAAIGGIGGGLAGFFS